MSAKKADTKQAEAADAKAADKAAPAAPAADPSLEANNPDLAIANKLIDELNRVHVRIPRY
ncbi:MAG: hypothetical protein LBR53_08785 [Deltaproteobacteria bacterium]|jgi:hypothetical protein|nr:hypothetical protein [Deltaproteobacteria bacterium]